MNHFPPNINPRILTLSSVLVGYALIGNFTALEQMAIGNWFYNVGQIINTNSSFQQLIERRLQGNILNINSKRAKEGGDPYGHEEPWINPNGGFNMSEEECINYLERAINIMQEELNKLKNNL